MKEYQVELKVKGEGGVYPYIVSAMKEECAEQDAIQMLLRDFPIFNGREIYKYKIIDLTKRRITNYEDYEDLLRALYIITLGDKENSIKTINSLLKINYSKDVKNFLIRLKETLENEE